jgi:hypothetical protein
VVGWLALGWQAGGVKIHEAVARGDWLVVRAWRVMDFLSSVAAELDEPHGADYYSMARWGHIRGINQAWQGQFA